VGNFTILFSVWWNGTAFAAWPESSKLTALDGADYDEFGISVSTTDNYAIVGSYYDDDNGTESGPAIAAVFRDRAKPTGGTPALPWSTGTETAWRIL
jgi:hypothetical protein